MGMGHGHYVFRDMVTGEEVYSTMNRARFTAYTEFGMPSPSPVEILEKIIPEEELWPPEPGGSWESHHAYRAWVGNTWLMQDMIEDYFGPSANLEELVANGQLLQCEGYKAIYEEARRQKPYCSMALNWCYNEPWPTAANNSLINWPNLPKPGFYAVRDACRPVMASARNTRLVWKKGERFSTQLWMLNDRYARLESGVVQAKLVAGEKELPLGTWEFEGAGPNSNLQGPDVSGILPGWKTDRFHLVLEVKGHPEHNSSYTFLYHPK
jgi:beta-mannosidase